MTDAKRLINILKSAFIPDNMKTIFQFFAGFFQDQSAPSDHAGSRKAITLYILLFFLWPFARNGATGAPVNETAFFGILAGVLFCLGAITSEFFKRPEK